MAKPEKSTRSRTRRQVIVEPAGIALLVLVAGLLWGCARKPDGEDTPPVATGRAWQEVLGDRSPTQLNVILVTIDTLRADRLSSYGNPVPLTPNIDAVVGEGIRFANAASTVPFTLPAHSSIMTGTYPPYHGVRENVGYTLDESIPTLAEWLGNRGFSTGGFVSAFVLDSRWGIARGFDTYYDDFDLDEMKGNLGSVQRDGRETIEAAVQWLDSPPESPFLLWLHLFDPHDPYTPPEPFRSQYPRRPYDAEVAYTDSLIGDFRGALEERGLLDNSLLILTGDHGEGLGQHKEGFHGFFVYDSTVHVPLIIRLPAGRLGGRLVEEVVSHVDLLPTILEATGHEIPSGVQGRSLLPLVLGEDEPSERSVYTESLYPLLHYGWSPLRSIRTRTHKFIDAPDPELYDLTADREESENVLLKDRRLARELKDRLTELVAEIEREGIDRAGTADLDEETLQQLRALGYVAGQGGVAAEEESDQPRADPKERIELHRAIMAAQSDLGRENPEQAARRLEEVLEIDPTIIDAHQMLGTIASQREDFEGAIGHFRRALELDSDHTTSLFGLAGSYRRLGRLDEALVGFRRLLDLNPGDSKAIVAIAQIHVDRDERREAIALLEEATQSPEAVAILFHQLGELLVLEGRTEEAHRSFEQAAKKNEELAQPRFNLAVLEEEAGNLARAVDLYEETIELAPNHFEAQFNLGRLYGLRGNLDRQQKLYEAALSSNPEFIRGYFFLAKLLMDRGGDLERAEELTREGLAKDPESKTGPLGHYLLADILNRTGRQSEARQAVATARAIEARQSVGTDS
ncbi:MAG: tetratricopeptide repeat protein [Acidobacteria bacterium]|nr:MAG: tetratricopeptide repeat protein [Acidobacteriota bacterium]